MSPRAWRARLGYTGTKMGEFVGVTSAAWRQYELGTRVPSIDLIVLCEELSEGQVTSRSWLDVSLSLPKIPPGRFNGNRLPQRSEVHAARA